MNECDNLDIKPVTKITYGTKLRLCPFVESQLSVQSFNFHILSFCIILSPYGMHFHYF